MYLIVILSSLLTAYVADSVKLNNVTFHNRNVQIDGQNILFKYESEEFKKLAAAVYSICEYATTCLSNEEWVEQYDRFRPCCFECDCFDDCYIRGSCCSNKTGDTTLNKYGVPVNNNGESCVQIPSRGSIDKDFNSALMVAQCPLEFHGDEQHFCENPNDANIDELTPVTDTNTEITFRNVHCAMCNGYNTGTTTVWKMNLKCLTFIPFHLIHESVIDTFMELAFEYHCQIYFTAPLPVKKCYINGHDEKCNNFECTGQVNSGRMRNLQDKIEYENCLQIESYHPDQKYFEDYEFAVLLNIFRETPLMNPNREANLVSFKNCDGDLLSHCLAKVCPPSQLTVNTGTFRCIEPIDSLMGVALDVRVKVIPKGNDLIMDNILSEIPFLLFTKEFLFNNPYECVYMSVSNIESNTLYHIAVGIHIKELNDIHGLYTSLTTKFGHVDSPSITEMYADSDVYAFKPMSLRVVNYASFADDNAITSKLACQQTVAMHKLQFCETYMFTEDEFVMVNKVAILKDGVAFNEPEYLIREHESGSLYIQVCVEDYNSKKGYRQPIEDFGGTPSRSSQHLPHALSKLLFIYRLLKVIRSYQQLNFNC